MSNQERWRLQLQTKSKKQEDLNWADLIRAYCTPTLRQLQYTHQYGQLFHFCCSDKNTLTKSNLGKEGFASVYSSRLQPIVVGTQGRNLKWLITATVDSTEQCMHACLPIHLPVLGSVSPLLHSSGPCLGKGVAHCKPSLPISINLIKAIPHRYTHRPTQCRQSLIENLPR